MDLYQTLNRLREKYTDADDVVRLDAEYARISTLLKVKGLAENEAIQELVALCRADVLNARKKLATDKSLIGDEQAQRELWFIVEAREWFLKLVTRDFNGELATIEAELQSELDS